MDFYERPAAVKELGKFLEQLPVQPYLDELTVILLLLEVSAPLAPRTSAKKIEKKSSPAKTAEELREPLPKRSHRIFASPSPTLLIMGGERASKTRQRLEGRICYSCSVPLDTSWQKPGERSCSRCNSPNKPRRVRMAFVLMNDRWRCIFTDEAQGTTLSRTLSFVLKERVTELVRRGGGLKCLADVQALEHGLRSGRGNVTLSLTPHQYVRLAR